MEYSVKPTSSIAFLMARITLVRVTILACNVSRRRSRKRYFRRMSSGYSCSPATGMGSSAAADRTVALRANTSIAPVGRLGFTVLAERAFTTPSMVTTLSARKPSSTASAGVSLSATIWVMP